MVVVNNKNLSRFKNPIKENFPLCDRIGQLKNTRYVGSIIIIFHLNQWVSF